MTSPNPSGQDRLTHADASGFRMVDVADKSVTLRSATAEARVRLNPTSAKLVREQRNKKGDTLAVAQLAGIQAVKHTATLVPLCHPLPINGVEVDVSLDDQESVQIIATVRTTARTGVEMEALHAASVSALTIIDMVKSVQRDASIQHVRLLEKIGGTRGDYQAEGQKPSRADACKLDGVNAKWSEVSCFVLTVSDRASHGVYKDRGGPAILDWLSQRAGGNHATHAIMPDEAERIEAQLCSWCDQASGAIQLLLTTGGTGSGPRDVTPEATRQVVERLHPGLTEHARRVTSAAHPLAALSRSVAGVRGTTLIINLPGSPRGAIEWLDALEPMIPHLLATLKPKS